LPIHAASQRRKNETTKTSSGKFKRVVTSSSHSSAAAWGPAVFAAVDEQRTAQGKPPAYNPEKITGFAFGMGVERIAMIQHGIADIGHFYSGDMRFLEQFA
jgi:hypothetical protein